MLPRNAHRQDLLQRAVQLAAAAGAKVALDLASFEVVRSFRADVEALLAAGGIEVCFGNEVQQPPECAPCCSGRDACWAF